MSSGTINGVGIHDENYIHIKELIPVIYSIKSYGQVEL